MTKRENRFSRRFWSIAVSVLYSMLIATPAWCATWYVDAATGSAAHSGKSMNDAFASIQTAIDKAAIDDTIIVNDGTYDPITVGKRMTIQSVNGKDVTIIDGHGSQRCATLWSDRSVMNPNSALIGFTLRNGFSTNGGGAQNGTLIDCTITECRTTDYGAGAYASFLHRCIVENCVNSGSYGCGGGTMDCDVVKCIVRNNKAYDGAGVYSGYGWSSLIVNNIATARGGGCLGSSLWNCTICKNIAPSAGGDAWGRLVNCVVWNNYTSASRTTLSNYHPDFVYHSYCCTWPNPNVSSNNISEDPCFIDFEHDDFRLRKDSPVLDKGVNLRSDSDLYKYILTDLLGNERIRESRIDLGAYEFQNGTIPDKSRVWYVDAECGSAQNNGRRVQKLMQVSLAVSS